MSKLFEFEGFDDENPQPQVLKISNLLPANWQQRAADWKMHSVCPGLSVTADGSVTFDSIAYHKQLPGCTGVRDFIGYKWSKERICFSVTDKKGDKMYLKGTFSV